MDSQFYTFKAVVISAYDIPIPFDKKITTENEDEQFIWGFRFFVYTKKRSAKEIGKFLAYHLSETKATPTQFLTHTNDLLKANEKEFAFNKFSLGDAREWLKTEIKKLPVSGKKEKPKKIDQTFESIQKDPKRMIEILRILKTNEIIDSDNIWRGKKVELVALLYILVDAKVIFDMPKAELGRIFSETFKCKMNPRMYSTLPKNLTIERIHRALPFLKNPS